MTPLQELLNWVDRELRLDGYEHKEIMLKILELKDKEEKMVVDAWEDGRLNEAGLSEVLNGIQFYIEYSKQNSNESNEL
jgi:plasmid rolling circle replication initiator protein Rep